MKDLVFLISFRVVAAVKDCVFVLQFSRTGREQSRIVFLFRVVGSSLGFVFVFTVQCLGALHAVKSLSKDQASQSVKVQSSGFSLVAHSQGLGFCLQLLI